MAKFGFRSALVMILVALLSFWLRVWGIQFGLPFIYHPDEQQYILPAIGVVSGKFEPLAHYNPAFYPYLIGFIYTLTYLGLKLFNAFPASFDLSVGWSEPMLPWITGIVYLARYTSAAAGLLTALVVYQVGRRAYGPAAGVAGAIVFGFAFLPAREAHFAVSDAPVALGTALVLYFCLDIVRSGHWSRYLWAGIGLGLSAATKYSAGLLILPIGAAHLLSQKYNSWLDRVRYSALPVMTGLVALIVYLIASPYTLLQREAFWADFSENLESARAGFQGLDLDPAGGAIFYFKSLVWGFGWPLCLLFLAAIMLGLWRHRRADLLLLTLPLAGFYYMQRQEMYFARWLMPFLPPLAVLAGEAIQAGLGYLMRLRVEPFQNLPPRLRAAPHPGAAHSGVAHSGAASLTRLNWLTVGAAILLTLPSTYMVIRADHILNRPDTRTEAFHWIQANIPAGSNVAAEILSPPWGPPLALPGLQIGPYNFAPVPDGGVAELNFEQYRAWQVQYVAASSFHYARPLRDKAHQDTLAAHLHALDRQAELVALFQPYTRDYDGFFYHDQVYGPANDTLYRHRPGPVIRIYRLP